MKQGYIAAVVLALFVGGLSFATEEREMTSEEREVATDARGMTTDDQGMTTEELSMAARERGVRSLDRSWFGLLIGGTSNKSKVRDFALLRSGDAGFEGLLRITSNLHLEMGFKSGEAEILDQKGETGLSYAPRECGAPEDDQLPTWIVIEECLWRFDYSYTAGGKREYDLQRLGARFSIYPQLGALPVRLSVSAGVTERVLVDDPWVNAEGCTQYAYSGLVFGSPDLVWYIACQPPRIELLDLGFIREDVVTEATYFRPSVSALFDGRFEPEIGFMFIEDEDMSISLGVTVHLRDYMRTKFSMGSASGDQREKSVVVSFAF